MPMRYIGYIVAIAIAVAGFVAGLLAGPGGWLIVGLAVGFFVITIWFIIRREQATVRGEDDTIWALFQVDMITGIIAVVVWAAITALTYVVYRFVLNLPV